MRNGHPRGLLQLPVPPARLETGTRLPFRRGDLDRDKTPGYAPAFSFLYFST